MKTYITPKIDDKILEFCHHIVKDSKPLNHILKDSIHLQHIAKDLMPLPTPIYIKINPTPNAEIRSCGQNVMNHIREHGGKLEYGWNILLLPDLFFSAEAHAIWISEDGKRHDITPHEYSTDSILYLPHDECIVEYEYKYKTFPPNYLYSCTNSQLVKKLVYLINFASYEFYGRRGIVDFTCEEAISAVFTDDTIRQYKELLKHLNLHSLS